MIDGRTYYQILGVLEDAEDIIIRAAYKVLAQKYHPDKWVGDLDFATKTMQGIARAYEVLSDKNARNAYDQELKAQGRYKSELGEDEDEQIISDDEENWKLACEFRPRLPRLASDLRMLRSALENQFKAFLLETKRFEIAEEVAKDLRGTYLSTYFGNNKEVQDFAMHLIISKRKKDALLLNKAVRVMGDSVSPQELFGYVNERSDFVSPKETKTQERPRQLAELILRHANKGDWELCIEFLSCFVIEVTTKKKVGMVYAVLVGKSMKKMDIDEFVVWVRNEMARPFIEKGYVPRDRWDFL
jgi:curved DNA-binding protein CbpA